MNMKKRTCCAFSLVLVLASGIYWWGHSDGQKGEAVPSLLTAAHAQDSPTRNITGEAATAQDFSRTGAVKNNDLFYYPGTEDLKPNEMRVTACGSGMPLPRLNQAAPCFLVELGNGDKFVFDIGTGATERLMSLQIPLDYINKVFVGHLHMDHMGDLPAFYLYGPQNGRLEPLHVWGPGGGGSRPDGA